MPMSAGTQQTLLKLARYWLNYALNGTGFHFSGAANYLQEYFSSISELPYSVFPENLENRFLDGLLPEGIAVIVRMDAVH